MKTRKLGFEDSVIVQVREEDGAKQFNLLWTMTVFWLLPTPSQTWRCDPCGKGVPPKAPDNRGVGRNLVLERKSLSLGLGGGVASGEPWWEVLQV